MSYSIAKPSVFLSRYVKHYWAIDHRLPVGAEHLQRIVPNGLSDLICYLGDKPQSTDRNHQVSENTVLAGQLSGPFDLKIRGQLSLFSIIFQPHGLSVFFDIPLRELFDQSVPLRYLIKNVVTELEEKLSAACSFAERIRLAERFLLNRLYRVETKYHFERIEDSILRIDRSRGQVSMDKLISAACFSRKQYERAFSTFIGSSPKQFLKIVRFQNTVDERSKNNDLSLTELAYLCGYYDQSHMIRDFQQLSGMTPRQYFQACEPYSDYFQ